MCSTGMRQRLSNEKYRRYSEAKSKIPKWLSAKEYEEQVKKLAKKYGV